MRPVIFAGLFAATAFAQQAQNLSPMVEYTRAHPRLVEASPPGRRETLELGTLFLPAKLKAPAPLFARLIAEAETKAGMKFSPVSLTAWSAGYGAVREILKVPEANARVEGVLLIDGLHTGYLDGRPGTGPSQDSRLETDALEIFVDQLHALPEMLRWLRR